MALPRLTFSFFLVILISCGRTDHHDPVLGEAFVGPANVNLRKDLAPSATVATCRAAVGSMRPSVRSPLLAMSSRPPDGGDGIEKAVIIRAAEMSVLKVRNLVIIIPLVNSVYISYDLVSYPSPQGPLYGMHCMPQTGWGRLL